MFVIRNQAYFYTDEYFAPDGGWVRLLKQTYASKPEADAACVAYNRKRMRKERLRDFLFDDPAPIAAVGKVMVAMFPDAYDYDAAYWFSDQVATVPKEATDDQVDAILVATKLVFAKVFEYDDQLDGAPLDPMVMEELYYGQVPESFEDGF